jgi:hypothetical protein
VTHIVCTPDAGIAEIPHVLAGRAPPNASANLGSQNYASRPVCVAVGGGFDDDTFGAIKKACGDAKVVWLRPDKSKLTQMPGFDEPERFGAATAVRVRDCMKQHAIGEGGKEEGEFLF